jgi:hypothetical protein
MKPIEILKQLKHAKTKEMYPNVPDIALPKLEYNDKSANALTKCVIDFLNLSGHQAERINTMGRMIDNRKQVTDVIGRTKTIGLAKYIPTTGTKGSADISATIFGRSVKIEVKYAKDRQSEAQKEYQAMVERAGGQYWIVKTFEDFYNKFKEFESNILNLNK